MGTGHARLRGRRCLRYDDRNSEGGYMVGVATLDPATSTIIIADNLGAVFDLAV